MALIYRLQVSPEIVQRFRSGEENIPTEMILFESTSEKSEFLADAGAFLKKIGVVGQEIPFNGLELPGSISVEELKSQPERVLYCYHRPPCKWYCHA